MASRHMLKSSVLGESQVFYRNNCVEESNGSVLERITHVLTGFNVALASASQIILVVRC